jgi:hypothetical protein
MSPSTSVRRVGIVTAGALALSLGGAITAGSASALTLCPVGQVLSNTGKCVQKTVDSVVPKPTTSSGGSTSGSTGGSTSSGGGVNIPLPSVPKLPLPSGGGSSSGGSSGGSSGSGLNLPGLPSIPLPGSGGGLGGGGLGGGGSTPLPGPTVPGSTTTSTSASNDPSSVPGATPGTGGGSGGMLGPASAYLPASGILGFSSLSSLNAVPTPVVSNLATTPSPLLASQPAAQLAAVQAPMLAAGDDAAGGGTVLAAFGGYALPGLLVVLATAIVGTVGAGNIRVWQARLAARRTA